MPIPIVLDTMVLQKANARLVEEPKVARKFSKRMQLLQEIQHGNWTVLFSDKLLAEYLRQVPSPRNDFVKAFFEIISTHSAGTVRKNWPHWPGRLREKMRDCRFPREDEHVLRTAHIEGTRVTLVSEELAILASAKCILRRFNVKIRDI